MQWKVSMYAKGYLCPKEALFSRVYHPCVRSDVTSTAYIFQI